MPKQRRNEKPTYNLYHMEGVESKWECKGELSEGIEWHHKTFYPYKLDFETLEPL